MPRQTRAKTREQLRRRRKILLRVLALILLILFACAPAYLLYMRENTAQVSEIYMDIAAEL